MRNELLKLAPYLKPIGIGVKLSKWVADLVSDTIKVEINTTISRPKFFTCCAIVGTQVKDAIVGQVSLIPKDATIWLVHFERIREAELLSEFANHMCLSKVSTTVRTAIMLGLALPRVDKGVISPTRTEPITFNEANEIYLNYKRLVYG